MTLLNAQPDAMKHLLTEAQAIAVVGMSDDTRRASYQIGMFLKQVGYTVYPVNPTLHQIDDLAVYHSLEDVPGPIDIVNVFRRSEYLHGVVEDAIRVGAKSVWAQLGVHDDTAIRRATEAKLPIITDLCIKVEYWRLNVQRPAPLD
ncbi:MAG: CoA-binding protein [Anaerolineae bacterium]|jgi:hypothetical protein|nr:CoA-binding protein [Anaerolineae bacterium]